MNRFKITLIPEGTPASERKLAIVLLVAFVLVGVLYSVVTPLFEASDEIWHYHFVRHLALGNSLPVQDAQNQGPWRQEGSQPPLYYYLTAGATFWVDTSDINHVARFNPHGDFGVITPDGNVNLVVHNQAAESWPWRQTALAVHIARLLSVLMSAGTVYFTYRIGLEVFSERRWLALAGAAAVAFLPMFVFISASVNNDNLAVLLSSAGLWQMLRLVRDADGETPTLRRALALGVVLGLSALAKNSAAGLFLLAGLTMAYVALRRKRWQTFFVEGPLILLVAAAIAGWWYWRNWQLYGDPLGWKVFLDIVGRRTPTDTPVVRLWAERVGFMWSYWGLFGGVGVPMALWTYKVLNTLALVSLPGIAVFLGLKFNRVDNSLSGWTPVLLSGLWPLIVAVTLANWANLTLASQGRLVFTAIASLQLWFVAGLAGWLPERAGKIVAVGLTGGLALLTLVAPFAWIAPAYQPPEELAAVPEGEIATLYTPGEDDPTIRLLDFAVSTDEVEPGGQIEVNLAWEMMNETSTNWSVFIHVTDNDEIIVAQRDTYPGLGTLATADIQPGFAWQDRTVITIPATAYAPNEATVYAGMYNLVTGERLLVNGDAETTLVELGPLTIEPPPNTLIPNPVSFNFGDQMRIVGYEMNSRSLAPGDQFTLNLYWRGVEDMDTDYTVFTHIIGPDTTIWGQLDAQPQGGGAPTSTWLPGELVEDSYTFTLRDDTPPGVYQVEIGIYSVGADGSITRLERFAEDGRIIENFLLLSPVRVVEQ